MTLHTIHKVWQFIQFNNHIVSHHFFTLRHDWLLCVFYAEPQTVRAWFAVRGSNEKVYCWGPQWAYATMSQIREVWLRARLCVQVANCLFISSSASCLTLSPWFHAAVQHFYNYVAVCFSWWDITTSFAQLIISPHADTRLCSWKGRILRVLRATDMFSSSFLLAPTLVSSANSLTRGITGLKWSPILTQMTSMSTLL